MGCLWPFGSSLDLKRAQNPKVVGSIPTPATTKNEGLADAGTANPFSFPPTALAVQLGTTREQFGAIQRDP